MNVASADIVGKVVAVTDGDTIKVLDDQRVEHKIRLTGIDAPEKSQAYGQASRKHLASLLAGKRVRIESVKKDRYGRVLGKVWVAPQDCPGCAPVLDANLAQIRAGMAWWYRYYASEQPAADRAGYEAAVIKARNSKLGLWREADPVPPWAWRRGQRLPSLSKGVADTECGTKRYCRQMVSCEEAKFYLLQCGQFSLDGNQDGVPCNSLCR